MLRIYNNPFTLYSQTNSQRVSIPFLQNQTRNLQTKMNETYEECIILPNTPEEELMKTWKPRVRFQLPSERQTGEYRIWLYDLLTEFVTWASPKNKSGWHRISILEENGREGGIEQMYVGEERFFGSKLYAYDGVTRPNIEGWKGVMFCDHLDKRSQVASIYRFANHLERFLHHKGIPYERFGLKMEDGHGEIKQMLQD
jgi:hypothetical protein